jgi:hypothetical protein
MRIGTRGRHRAGTSRARQRYAREIPNDPLFANQWNLRNTGQGGGTTGADANLTPHWTSVPGPGSGRE